MCIRDRILRADTQESADAIMIHSLHIGNFVKQLGINEAETDFVLFLPRRKLIVFIEVKNMSTPSNHAKASQQLQRNIKLIQDLFHDVLDDGGWQFSACAYFLDSSNPTICTECDKYTLLKDEDFDLWYHRLKSLCPVVTADEQEETKIRQKILKVVSLCLFTIHMRLPTTPSRSVDEIIELMQKIGDCQNVLFWSKEQYELITTEKYALVLLKAGYGAGKSIVMEAKCENVANRGFKSLYVLGGMKNKKPLLLNLKLSHKWKDNPNILVRSFNDIMVSHETIKPKENYILYPIVLKRISKALIFRFFQKELDQQVDQSNLSRPLFRFLNIHTDVKYIFIDEWGDEKSGNGNIGLGDLLDCYDTKKLLGIWLVLHRNYKKDSLSFQESSTAGLDRKTIEDRFYIPNLQFNLRNSKEIAEESRSRLHFTERVTEPKIGAAMVDGIKPRQYTVSREHFKKDFEKKLQESLRYCQEERQQNKIVVILPWFDQTKYSDLSLIHI